jgi:hypothetical protein
MRDTHVVAINIHWPIQTGEVDLAVDLWKRLLCDGVWQIALEIEHTAYSCQKGKDNCADQKSAKELSYYFHDSSRCEFS